MLSWIDDPSAIQVLLATATRFRTAGIRKLADECVREVAQRRGWTVDELADRTIPTAELDEDGHLELSYGSRTFRAKLGDDLSLALETEDGKALSSLPEPRQDDNKEAAALAKQTLSQAKKQLKVIAKQQRDRLYEAMCTQRHFRHADWATHLARHPVVGRLVQRVIWTTLGDNGRTFRPLGDGTLTGPDDDPVTLDSDVEIGVAHTSLVPPDMASRWLKHLADYEVEPLFNQLGRTAYALPDAAREETALRDFEGHIVEAFKLRGRATKLGYVRGETGDGGWFHEYVKQLPGLGLSVVIEFTGNGLPEENRKVGLVALHFRRAVPQGGADDVPLGEVPAVLLAESWNDIGDIAADGPGYDPDWQKSTEP